MKLLTILASILFFSLSSFAQKGVTVTPPDKVLKSFKERFPQAKTVTWKKDKNGEYEAKFMNNGNENRVDFDTEGNWMETESSVPFTELPKKIQDYINANYSDCKVVEAEKVMEPGKSYYEVEVKRKNKSKTDVHFTLDGDFIGEE